MSLLQKRIMEASQKYYSDGTSDVSDKEFDEMLDQLREEDPNSPLLDVGHGYDINKDSTVGERVKHRYGVAGSLDKCHSWSEIPKAFLESSIFWASVKLDGLSVVLYYKDGLLYQALTRGGGTSGIDITPKVRAILRTNVKLADRTFTGAVRGEIVMSFDNFSKYLLKHPDAKNPRNTAAGIINSKEWSKEDLDLLDIVVYTVVGHETFMNLPDDNNFKDYQHIWAWLLTNFNEVASFQIIDMSLSVRPEDTFIEQMNFLRDEWYGKYPSDGIVIAQDNVLQIGSEGDNRIKVIYTAIAFKFKAESEVTRIIGIEWNLTKTKYLVPRINVETVQLSGTNVSWATGFNAQNMKNQQLGIGAEVSIMKSGEIIPYIEDVITPVECELPTKCPCCGADLEWSGVHLQCPNIECADADLQDTLIWMKFIAPWDGLGDTLKIRYLSEMFGENISISKVYEHGEFNKLEVESDSVKETEFRKMFNAMFTNKVKLSDAIQALNIPRLGDVTSRKLAEHPDMIEYFIQAADYDEGDMHDYSSIIGEANFHSILNNIQKFKRLDFIRDQIIWETIEPENKGSVAITGKLSVKRAVFEEELRNAGYVPGNISKNTKFLITDDPNSSSDKNKKADKFGIQKITEAEFRRLYM